MAHFVKFLTFVCFTFLQWPAFANLANDLQDGSHVLLMRHADAPGYGDPAGYQLDKCETQRNLGEAGKKQSQKIGQWLKAQGIKEAVIFSSPWCRCKDTATLLELGAVTISPALGSFFDDMSQAKLQTKALRTLIQQNLQTKPLKPVILVTHHVNIEAFTSKPVSVGDMVLVRVDRHGNYISHTLYPAPKP